MDVAVIRPFRALRPRPDLAARVASPPYDVVDVTAARAMATGNELSFLHISRPEIDLPPGLNPYDDAVYGKGRANLDEFIGRGVLAHDHTPTLSIYRLSMGRHVQTGIAALAAVDDYETGVIAKHELTRPDKELDRTRHIDALEAQDEPVLLACHRNDEVEGVIARVVSRPPEIDVTTDDGVGHTVWVVSDPDDTARVTAAFAQVPRLYIADGHHRSAAAARVRQLRRQRGAGADGWRHHDGFLVVVFAADELSVMPYHRVVADLANHTPADLLARLDHSFEVTPVGGPPEPSHRHVIGMYLPGHWYRLGLRDGLVDHDDPVARLDVSVLQDNVLAPLLYVDNPRTDPRLGFVGGIHGTGELRRLVDSGSAAAAFALHATSVADLMALADDGRIMPPKSTWFEPKLRSGLFLHSLRD